LSLTAESVRCICGHPTPGIAWEWAPGHQGQSKCICCMRAIWEESLETILSSLQAALAAYPAVTSGECASGVGLEQEQEPCPHTVYANRWQGDANDFFCVRCGTPQDKDACPHTYCGVSENGVRCDDCGEYLWES